MYQTSNKTNFNLLEAVVTCVNFADFLDVSLEHNLCHFDRIVVVTTHEDEATRSVCTKHSIDCVCTDVFTENDSKFSKGLAINLGLGHLQCIGWVMHLDADIVLPDNFRQMLKMSGLREDCIYGADRLTVTNRVNFNNLKNSEKFKRQFRYRYILEPEFENTKLGARLVHKEYGYAPIGFFQLWWGPTNKKYPTVNNGSAEHTDVLHALQWPRSKRILLPTVFVYHLESETLPMGSNWNGRTSVKF